MPDNERGGTHEQHVRVGQQSHKNDETRQGQARNDDDNNNNSNRGGSHEQHVRAGQQSHKND